MAAQKTYSSTKSWPKSSLARVLELLLETQPFWFQERYKR